MSEIAFLCCIVRRRRRGSYASYDQQKSSRLCAMKALINSPLICILRIYHWPLHVVHKYMTCGGYLPTYLPPPFLSPVCLGSSFLRCCRKCYKGESPPMNPVILDLLQFQLLFMLFYSTSLPIWLANFFHYYIVLGYLPWHDGSSMMRCKDTRGSLRIAWTDE